MKTNVPRAVLVVSLSALWSVATAFGQIAAPNEAGISLSQWYTLVRDVDAAKKFWIVMGGTPIKIDGTDVIKFSGVLVFLKKGEPSGSDPWGTSIELTEGLSRF